GELVKKGIVDRILTTNFDPLLIRGCVMSGSAPAIYDCEAISNLESVLDRDIPAIYYLHGQVYGLRMLNGDAEIRAHSANVRRIVQQSIKRRALIVCGYKGDPDDG